MAVLTVLLMVIAAVGEQGAGRGQGQGQGQRGGRGGGAFMTQEARLEAIKTIEAQLAKLKAEPEMQRPQGGQDMSQEERTKFFEQMTKMRQERQKVLDTIIAQVAALQGSRAPEAAEGAKFVIVNTADLKPIQESAVKEKATETSQLLERLMARASGQRGFGAGQRGQRPEGERPQRQRQQQ
ncbi:MAG: hypothetical protein A2Z25_17835 [Planctomycetes bacterium RBG_16_55_9]|nr:MAG: hypothetical protein A2Z25_17835 [Planctomycetes bacterium RBG_16_55_9]